jgi:uncharacterized protein (DUF58 family)
VSRGRSVPLLGLALCLLAGALGAFALYVPGIALLLLTVLAEAGVRVAARGARITREPTHETVEEGAAVTFVARLKGRRLALAAGEISLWPGLALTPLRRMPGRRVEFTLRPLRRGRHVVGPSVLRFRDPFGIRSSVRSSLPTELLVLPRLERIARPMLERIGAAERRGSRRARGPSIAEVDGLRPYRQGAPATRIHWPTVARTGTFLERRLRSEGDRLPLVVLDSRLPADLPALDAAVRAAASLSFALARCGDCSLLLAGEQRALDLSSSLGAWPAMHARLALVEPGGALMWSRIERAEVIVWVTAGRQPDPRFLRRGAAGHFVVSPFPQAGRSVLFEIAGCTVQRAGRASAARAS